jgi:hypothetical protein
MGRNLRRTETRGKGYRNEPSFSQRRMSDDTDALAQAAELLARRGTRLEVVRTDAQGARVCAVGTACVAGRSVDWLGTKGIRPILT